MIPNSLDAWTYDAIVALCAVGQCESDRHDFKFHLPDARNLTKLCCAFANTFGGYFVIGVKEQSGHSFEAIGVDADTEVYGTLLGKVRVDPDIGISSPKMIQVIGSEKVLYVFQIQQSTRRPHLPSHADERIFWKRQGSSCVQMTLEEIRYQMNTYEEKREKLALLLIDLNHKEAFLKTEAQTSPDDYVYGTYTFDVFDRVTVEAFSLLKADVGLFDKLNRIQQRLMSLNGAKQRMFARIANGYQETPVRQYHAHVQGAAHEVTNLIREIERTIEERFGIKNPLKVA